MQHVALGRQLILGLETRIKKREIKKKKKKHYVNSLFHSEEVTVQGQSRTLNDKGQTS